MWELPWLHQKVLHSVDRSKCSLTASAQGHRALSAVSVVHIMYYTAVYMCKYRVNVFRTMLAGFILTCQHVYHHPAYPDHFFSFFTPAHAEHETTHSIKNNDSVNLPLTQRNLWKKYKEKD